MKKICLILVIYLFATHATAQIGYNYSQYDIGFSGFSNSSSTDFTKSVSKYAGSAHLTYNYSPFVNYVIEFQAGTLRGDSLTFIPKTYFQNQYSALMFRAQLQLGEFIDYSDSPLYNAFKNLYVGAGVGVIYSDTQVINADTLLAEKKASNIFIPLRVGYEFKVFNSYSEPVFKIDLGYQYNYALTDYLDGVAGGKSRDTFSQFFIGFKFAIGGVTSYRKAINY